MGASYLDASALVKLVVAEPESTALRRWMGGRGPYVTSVLSTVEVPRAVRHDGADAVERADQLLARVRLLTIDDAILHAARELDPAVLRSLDAIHLASAFAIGGDLEVVVAYDRRLLAAAEALELTTACPT